MPPPNTPEDDEDEVPDLVQTAREPIPSTRRGGDRPMTLLETWRRMQALVDDDSPSHPNLSRVTTQLHLGVPQLFRLNRASFPASRAPPVSETSASSVSETSASSGSRTPEPPTTIDTIDWQGLEYIGPVDDNLICPICKTPFANPHTTRACGHTFCKPCIDQALRLQPACPICRTHMQHGSPVRCPIIIFGLLDKLEVKCPNTLCVWAGCRSALVAHVDQCLFTLLPCPDRNCTQMVMRKDVTTRKCLHYVSPCIWCQKPVEMAKLEEHCWTACEKYTEECETCNETVCVYKRELHDSQCQEMVVDCAFASIGCTARYRRADMPPHERVCPHGVFKRLEDRHRAEMDDARDRIMQEMDVAIQRKEQQIWAQLEEQVDNMLCGIEDQLFQTVAERAEQRYPSLNWSVEHRRAALRQPPPSTTSTQNTAATAASAASTSSEPEGSGNAPGDPEGLHCVNCEARDEYMFSMFADLESRINSLVSTVSEQDHRHYAMLVNELMPLKEQLAEARSQQGVVGMHVRWLMDLQRQRRVADRQNINGAAAAAAVGNNMPEAAAPSGGGGGAVSVAASSTSGGGGGGDGAGAGQAPRRLSERMMNPPRL